MKLPTIGKNFRNLVPSGGAVLRRLGRVVVSSTVAGVSWFNLSGVALASPAAAPGSAEASSATTVMMRDRAKKAAKLVLRLTTTGSGLIAQHRSHRSHQSHYSSRSAPESQQKPATAPPAQTDPLEEQVTITIAKLDTDGRMLSGKDELGLLFEFFYRDYTKVPVGASSDLLQLDAWSEKNPGESPFAVGQKVRVAWKYSEDKKKRIAVKITPAKSTRKE